MTISYQNHGHSYGFGTPFAARTTSTLQGRLSTRCWNIAAGSCFHSDTRALVSSDTNVKPGSQSAFQFIPKMFDGVETRALCRPVKFFHTDLDKPFLYRPRFVHRGIVILKQEKAFPKLFPQSRKHSIF
jgi:hypothetical protein